MLGRCQEITQIIILLPVSRRDGPLETTGGIAGPAPEVVLSIRTSSSTAFQSFLVNIAGWGPGLEETCCRVGPPALPETASVRNTPPCCSGFEPIPL